MAIVKIDGMDTPEGRAAEKAYMASLPKRAVCMDCGILGYKDKPCTVCRKLLTWDDEVNPAMAQFLSRK